MIRTKGEAGTGNVVEAVRHMRAVMGEIRRLSTCTRRAVCRGQGPQAPYELVQRGRRARQLPVVNFAAGGIATPADAALMMQLGADGVFVGSGIFKSGDPARRARAIVEATTHFRDARSSPRSAATSASRWSAAWRRSRADQLLPRAAGRTGMAKIGVLALQGAFRQHCAALRRLGHAAGRGAAAGRPGRRRGPRSSRAASRPPSTCCSTGRGSGRAAAGRLHAGCPRSAPAPGYRAVRHRRWTGCRTSGSWRRSTSSRSATAPPESDLIDRSGCRCIRCARDDVDAASAAGPAARPAEAASTIARRRCRTPACPRAAGPRSGSRRPVPSSSLSMVVDSPPGMTSPSSRARSPGMRTSTASCAEPPDSVDVLAERALQREDADVAGRLTSRACASSSRRRASSSIVEPDHRLAEACGDLGDELGVAEVRRRLDDRRGPRAGSPRLEDARADEHAVGAELHHQRGVGRRGDAAGGEEDDRQPAGLGDPLHELAAAPQLLGRVVQLVRSAWPSCGSRRVIARMWRDGLDDVAGAGLALRADHRRALADAAQRLAEVRAPQTNGTVNAHLSMWCASSAGVSTSDSSM